LCGKIRTENGWNGLNALAPISKYAFRKFSLFIFYHYYLSIYLFTNIKKFLC
jgi:hypothetical protein